MECSSWHTGTTAQLEHNQHFFSEFNTDYPTSDSSSDGDGHMNYPECSSTAQSGYSINPYTNAAADYYCLNNVPMTDMGQLPEPLCRTYTDLHYQYNSDIRSYDRSGEDSDSSGT